MINGKKLTIAQLANACIERHGVEVLEGTVNRKLIELACHKNEITVTEEEIDAEIARAASVSVPLKEDGSPDVEGWLKLVTKQQRISVDLYRRDSVWPTVALKKLVGNTVKVTQADLDKGYEANYAVRVRCRADSRWHSTKQEPTQRRAPAASISQGHQVRLESISLQALTNPFTASTDLSNISCSSLLSLMSTIRAMPPEPITVGTPT